MDAGHVNPKQRYPFEKDIKPLTHTLAAIQQLKGYSYHWKDPNNPDEQIGLLAQELQKVYPQLVKENDRGDLSVNYSGMVPVLLEAIKELQQRVAQLEEKLK
ncbi:MAG: tail fiber domain-containing protein [Saprospiraceae bacterium]|nr:tail fiber domain-containing protein [Saprospiraceae bacterium]